MRVGKSYIVSRFSPKELSPDELKKIMDEMETKGEEVTPEKMQKIRKEYIENQKSEFDRKQKEEIQIEKKIIKEVEGGN